LRVLPANGTPDPAKVVCKSTKCRVGGGRSRVKVKYHIARQSG